MSREISIEKALAKVRKAYDKMEASRDVDWTSETVKINKRLSILIECIRTEYGENKGRAGCYQFYAIKDGEPIDCCSLSIFNPQEVDKEIRYLLVCYI